ncbi:hypothetical protein ACNOYE_16835 [Nannocystaceae bacterium ST9]
MHTTVVEITDGFLGFATWFARYDGKRQLEKDAGAQRRSLNGHRTPNSDRLPSRIPKSKSGLAHGFGFTILNMLTAHAHHVVENPSTPTGLLNARYNAQFGS